MRLLPAAGLVLNEMPNIDRREFDRLKVILTNCTRGGCGKNPSLYY